MIKYLRMDIKRLFKTRAFYVTILAAILVLALFATAGWFLADNFTRGEDMGGLPMGSLIEQARKMFNVARFSSFFMGSPSLHHLLLVVFAAGFISKDHQTGYLKNLFVLQGLREKWLVSKLITMLLAGVLYYLGIILAAAGATLLFGNAPQINVAQLGSFFGLHLTADLALFAILCLTVAFFQSKTSAVVVGMLLSFNIQNLIFLLLDQIGFLPFKLTDYGMMNLVGRLDITTFGGASPDMLSSAMNSMGGGMGGNPTTAAKLLPVTLGWFAVATLLSWMTLRWRDYKG